MGLLMELRHYYEVIRKRAWIIVVVVVLAVGGTALLFGNQPPEYQAEVSMLVTPRVMAPTAFDDAGRDSQTAYFTLSSAYDETVVNDTIQLLKTKTLIERVANRVGLNVQELQRRLKRKDIIGTHYQVITATDGDPARAALIANTVAQEFRGFYAELNRAEATRARDFLNGEVSLAQTRLASAEAALLAFRTRTGTVALSEEISRTTQRFIDLQAAYDTARLDEKVAQTRMRTRIRSQRDGQVASVEVATNPAITQVRDHLTGLEIELAKLRQVYTDEHPKVGAILGQIADDRQRLRTEAQKVASNQSLGSSPIRQEFVRELVNAEVDAAAARAKAAGIIPILGRLEAKLNTRASDEVTLLQLQRNARIAEQLFTRLSTLHQEAVIKESKAGSSGQAAIMIVDQAAVPERPVPSQLPKRAGLAGLLGLLAGAGLALVGETFDDRIRSSRQAEVVSGTPVLATVPAMSARNYRRLTSAPGVTGTLLSLFMVLALVLGGASGLFLAQSKAISSSVVQVSQTLRQAFHPSW